jgi:hypothetical protein
MIAKVGSETVNRKVWMASGNTPFKTIPGLTAASNKTVNLPKA